MRTAVAILAAFFLTAIVFRAIQTDAADRAVLSAALITAVQNSNSAEVRRLLDRGADPNARIAEPQYDAWTRFRMFLRVAAPRREGEPVLLEAVRRNDSTSVSLLLDHGADPNGQGTGGYTPLMAAPLFDSADVAANLLDHHADPSRQNDQGFTAFKIAQNMNRHKVLRLLSERGITH